MKKWKKTLTMEMRVEQHNYRWEKFEPKEDHQKWTYDSHGRIIATCCDSTWILGLHSPGEEPTNCVCGTHRDDFNISPCYDCNITLEGNVGYNFTVEVIHEDKEFPYLPMTYSILCFECAVKTSPGLEKRLEEETKNLV
jgi:hypothetical protein